LSHTSACNGSATLLHSGHPPAVYEGKGGTPNLILTAVVNSMSVSGVWGVYNCDYLIYLSILLL